jgi:hypothetical protein
MKLAPIIPIRRNEPPPEKDGWARELKLVQDAGGSGMIGRRELKWVAGEEAGSIYPHSHRLSQPVPPDALTAIFSVMEPKAWPTS